MLKPIKPVFDGAAKTVRMDTARYVDPDTREQKIVQLPGTLLKEGGVHYYEPQHKAHLFCAHCDANVRAIPESSTAVSGSSLKGASAHFALYPGQRHDKECEFYAGRRTLRLPGVRADSQKGFRIHINTREYSDLFTPQEGSYRRDGAITEILEEDLKDREIYPVKSAADLVKFMAASDPLRINDSVIIFNNQPPIAWKNFFIRYNRAGQDEPRFMELFHALQKGGKGAQFPVLMEMQIKRPFTVSSSTRHASVNSRRIPYLQDDDGTRHDIIPSVLIDRTMAWHNTHLSSAFSYGTKQLVLGLAMLRHPRDGHYYINVAVNDPQQVTTVNIENVMKKAAAKARIGQLPPESTPAQP